MGLSDITVSLLAEREWLRRLAGALVRDPNEADDLVQETYVEALEKPPVDVGQPRGWLATVMRRRLGRLRMSGARRTAREARASRTEADDADDTAETEARLARCEALVRHVHALSEPYRTALVLRYLEDTPPRTIAARQGVPVATVQSRLNRGLQQLRARLDAEHGGRREWLAAVAALCHPRDGAAVLPGMAIGVATYVSTKVWFAFGAALMVLSLVLFTRSHSSAGANPEQPSRRSDGLETAYVGSRMPDRVPRSGGERTDATRRTVPRENGGNGPGELAPPVASVRGRVVDPRGRPIPGVAVLHHGSTWPRWQGGDIGWITDGRDSRFLPPQEVAALRAEPARVEKVFRDVHSPADWRHVVLGEPLPERTTQTDARGEFEFTGLAAGVTLELADTGWLLVGEKSAEDGSTVLVATRAVEVAGLVLDAALEAAEGARVNVHWSPELALAPALCELRRTWSPLQVNVDSGGRYLLRSVPPELVGCMLQATRGSEESVPIAPPSIACDDLNLTLLGSSREARAVGGRVIDPVGAPVVGAQVYLGSERRLTAVDGSFLFESVAPVSDVVLTALAPGFTPARSLDLYERLREVAQQRVTVELQLDTLAVTLLRRGAGQ
jgi:RNA polymerase sigma-70 factor (ECF subfamily)